MTDLMRDRGSPPDTDYRPDGPVAEFEQLYRANFGLVLAYFARRTTDPQIAADLTADTFVAAITSFGTFDPRRGSPRGWLLGIAKNVYARHCENTSRARDAMARLGGRRALDIDEASELLVRIDDERSGRELLASLAELAPVDRGAVELVDVAGLTPKEAAAALGISAGALRVRLFRARAKLRNLFDHNRKGAK
ncbi:RNA polymerase sigma factor [Nocardia arthritidis]|uniref:RNA polymerase sigma factor n=1 Tax=Nocardia arthritidis TaxID=228602 RepID=UPI00142E08AD|nr:sigma-70 family RNA polymerase sigma factor [Nocardia arthritidis]